MLKKEYRRYLISYRSLVFMIGMMVVTAISYYFTFLQKKVYIREYMSGAEDLDLARMKTLIDGYNGFHFFFNLYDASDEFFFICIILFSWLGIFLSSEMYMFKENGYGNLLVARMNFSKYYKKICIAQILYITTLLGIMFFSQLILGFVVGGADSLWFRSGEHLYDAFHCVLIVLGMFFIISFYTICINIMSCAFMCLIHNRYMMQVVPVLVFVIVPLLIGSTIANVFSINENVNNVINPFWYLCCIVNSFINTFYFGEFSALVLSMLLFGTGAIIAGILNVKRMGRDYL